MEEIVTAKIQLTTPGQPAVSYLFYHPSSSPHCNLIKSINNKKKNSRNNPNKFLKEIIT